MSRPGEVPCKDSKDYSSMIPSSVRAMTPKPTIWIFLACATIGTGCGSDGALEPVTPQPPVVPPPALTTVDVTPASIRLFPGMTKQLSVTAWDQHGRPLNWTADAVTYTSSNPAIVTESNRGALVAKSPGTAMITVTVTVNGIARTRNVTTEVMDLRPGNYELSAPVSESGWGVEGGRFKALLMILPGSLPDGSAPVNPIGTFTNLHLAGPDGATLDSASAGLVTSEIDVRGRLKVLLIVDQRVRWEGYIESSGQHDITGHFWIGDGLAAGNFIAKRVSD